MKVVISFNHLNPGGITTYIQSLCKGLQKERHQVYLISSAHPSGANLTPYIEDHLRIPIDTSSEINPRLIPAHLTMRRFLDRIKPDILHSNSRVTQVLSAAATRGSNIKRVFTCHGFFKTRWFRRMFPLWGDRVIAVSPQVKKHLIDDWLLESQKIDVIMHGVQIHADNHSSDQELVRKKYGIPCDRFVVGAFGRYSDVKGFDRLISAASLLSKNISNVLIVIAGNGSEYQYYQKLIKGHGLERWVQVISNDTQVRSDIVRSFDLFCAPSRQEGLGLSIMEAMGNRVPVVASNVGGIPHLITDNEEGLLCSADSENSLVSAIVRMYTDEDLRNKCSQKAYLKAQYLFSLDRMIHSTVETYEKTI